MNEIINIHNGKQKIFKGIFQKYTTKKISGKIVTKVNVSDVEEIYGNLKIEKISFIEPKYSEKFNKGDKIKFQSRLIEIKSICKQAALPEYLFQPTLVEPIY